MTVSPALEAPGLSDEEIASREATEARMRADGVPTTDNVEVDYFGFTESGRVTLPDGKQWIEFKVMNEGERTRFQQKTNRDVVVARTTGDARMKMDPATERHELLKTSITNWHLLRKDPKKGDWYPLPFTQNELAVFLEKAPPTIINLIEKEIRKANPWLMSEMSADDIRKEISDLTELLEVKEREEQGKPASSN